MYKIKWVRTYFDGPVNGIIEKDGVEYWFTRLDSPSFSAYPFGKGTNSNSKVEGIQLSNINDKLKETVFRDHVTRSHRNNSCVYHGDNRSVEELDLLHLVKENEPLADRFKDWTSIPNLNITVTSYSYNDEEIKAAVTNHSVIKVEDVDNYWD